MKILVTNDDSVSAPQLIPLIRWCQKLGKVTVVVPKFEQSGKSQGVELLKGFEVKKVDLTPDISAYVVDSTPADCVRFAVLGLQEKYDLVITGVNRGYNIGKDILYSGTVSAACEAAAWGMKAIAFSTSIKYYDQAIEPLDKVWAFFQEHKLLDVCDHYNVNVIPDDKGIRIVRMGERYYCDSFVPQGNDIYKAQGKRIWQDSGELLLDTDCIVHGYITIMPLSFSRVNMEAYNKLVHLSQE